MTMNNMDLSLTNLLCSPLQHRKECSPSQASQGQERHRGNHLSLFVSSFSFDRAVFKKKTQICQLRSVMGLSPDGQKRLMSPQQQAEMRRRRLSSMMNGSGSPTGGGGGGGVSGASSSFPQVTMYEQGGAGGSGDFSMTVPSLPDVRRGSAMSTGGLSVRQYYDNEHYTLAGSTSVASGLSGMAGRSSRSRSKHQLEGVTSVRFGESVVKGNSGSPLMQEARYKALGKIKESEALETRITSALLKESAAIGANASKIPVTQLNDSVKMAS